MNRIVNDFIVELPELEIDIDSISQEWVDAHKPKKRFRILADVPTDPVLKNLVSKLNGSIFHERLVYMLIRFDPYESYDSIYNESALERVLFTVHFKSTLTFETLKEGFLNNETIFFNQDLIL